MTSVTDIIQANDNGFGCPWNAYFRDMAEQGIDEEAAERLLNEAMDQGLVYEPVLGVLKVL